MTKTIAVLFFFSSISLAASLENHDLHIKNWDRTTFKTSSEVEYNLRLKDGESFYEHPCERLNSDDYEEQYNEAYALARAACTRNVFNSGSSSITGVESCAHAKTLEALKIDSVCGSSHPPITWISSYNKLAKSKKCLMELFLYSPKKDVFHDRMSLGTNVELSLSGDMEIESGRSIIPLKITRTNDGKTKTLGDAKLVCLPNTDIEDVNKALSEDFGITEGLKLPLKPRKKMSDGEISRGVASEISLDVPWRKKSKK